MAKFLGSLCALGAALSLVAVSYIWAVAGLTDDDFADAVVADVIEDPEARAEIADEIVQWFAEQPDRRAVLQAAFGDEWVEPTREAAELAVQTPEFAAAYQAAFDEIQAAEPGEPTALTIDLGPAAAAIAPDLDPAAADAIQGLPSDFFVVQDDFNSSDWNDLREFRTETEQVASVGVIIGLVSAGLAIALFRSAGPLAFIGSVAMVSAALVAVLLYSVRPDVLADTGSAVERVAVESVIASILWSTLWLGLTGLALFIASSAIKRILATFQGRSDSTQMPTGSDTDWADARAEAGFPQIIS